MQFQGFEGWYFKHQLGDDAIAFIPGQAREGAFVQMICADGSRQFDFPRLVSHGDSVRVGDCFFSPHGCQIDLPGVKGTLRYGPLAPLRSDIMGPFRFLPLECRHGVVSMGHSLTGSLLVDGKLHGFNGGQGYLEKDRGRSFPRSYLWLQCNDFSLPCSLMLSLAEIPLGFVTFTGCLCAILWQGREYRFATYTGVRIQEATKNFICLAQGKLLLTVEITPASDHPLRSPVNGQMQGLIREGLNASIKVSLWEDGTQLFRLHSDHAAYECVAPPAQ